MLVKWNLIFVPIYIFPLMKELEHSFTCLFRNNLFIIGNYDVEGKEEL